MIKRRKEGPDWLACPVNQTCLRRLDSHQDDISIFMIPHNEYNFNDTTTKIKPEICLKRSVTITQLLRNPDYCHIQVPRPDTYAQ